MSAESVLKQISNPENAGILRIRSFDNYSQPQEDIVFETYSDVHFKGLPTGTLAIFLGKDKKLNKVLIPAISPAWFQSSNEFQS